jgi:hypothetical protein
MVTMNSAVAIAPVPENSYVNPMLHPFSLRLTVNFVGGAGAAADVGAAPRILVTFDGVARATHTAAILVTILATISASC